LNEHSRGFPDVAALIRGIGSSHDPPHSVRSLTLPRCGRRAFVRDPGCSASAARHRTAHPAIEAHVEALVPDLEAYTGSAMKAFGVPGLAIGRRRRPPRLRQGLPRAQQGRGCASRCSHGVFQVGSATKAFLAATIGIMVDRKKFHRDDRVVDLYPEFQLKDPWVTREFRVFDLLAQRSVARSVLRDIRVASKQELKDRIMAAMDEFNRHPVVHTWSYKLDKAA
jgi:CubicO group peptidase (beta-lactamase class C family)